ncbi:RAMP superfamily CRISPR-associated protein [[Clostridium] polysaccharolyticum]|uniref:CRISPR/Cas system CSM-associated protein Csm3, group 7 of RAMP superfamily n=1 Tax=[Clostridium] polysaccharolyticum TaxID=29364 RepID=A0A1I0AUE1_9FIRM|nr:RAMP superfamily CRISPR-associated protein [[Clostridium] polysaccharolyticum]SES98041.1 CRISPR/Cas system CSM-associated protein Csm3, group 7 of RAMP superfamily [[Clostridium] polysaccharolyticum]
MGENRKIVKRIAIGVKIQTSSPLCVSSGWDEITDNDLQRDFYGKVFVPGTSLAGAMRAYLEKPESLFGFAKEMEGKMSSVSFSDLTFAENEHLKMSERDGVALVQKVAKSGAKYDIEIIEPGAYGAFQMLLSIREQDEEEQWLDAIKKIFFGINEGEIRFGSKKNRGFGKIKIESIYYKQFTSDNVDEWVAYNSEKNLYFKENKQEKSEWMKSDESHFVKLKVSLNLIGGISIRKYAISGDADFEHIRSKKVPVIPGTSWMGAIRQRVTHIATQLIGDESKAMQIIHQWFGYVAESQDGKNPDARQSSIIIRESVIKGGTELKITRNRINRFDNSTIDGALYTELGHFTGDTKLIILVRKENDYGDYRTIIGLLLLAIKDLENGYLALGGQTSVGRGIFKQGSDGIAIAENGTQTYEQLGNDKCLEYINELKAYVRGIKNVN